MFSWSSKRRFLKRGFIIVFIGFYLWTIKLVFLPFTAAHEKNDIPRNIQPDKVFSVMKTQLFHERFITNSNANTIVDEFADNSVEEVEGKRASNPVNHSFTPNNVGTSDKLYSTKNKKEYCSNFITYDFNKFAHVKDVVVDRKYSRGRKGGEKVEEVMNQSEQSEYYVIKRGFYKFVCPELEKYNMDFNMIEMTWKHHLKDWYKGIQHLQNQNEMSTLLSHVPTTEHKFTIAVTRYEYANLFHTMTDWYNAFYVMKVFNKVPQDVKILLIDGHPKSQLDVTWKTLFHTVEFIGHQTMSQIKYSELVWNIVGYESAFSKNLLSGGLPPLPLQEFSNFFLHAHGVSPVHQQNIKKLNILFLWRRDYLAHPRQTSSFKKSNVTIQRKIFNKEEIFGAVKTSFSQHTVHGVQLDLLTMKQQLEILVQTDILISMHGAGLTHVLFMPSSAGLIELFPQYIPYRPHFKVLSKWRKISYLKWTNMDGENELPNYKTRIPTDVILHLVEQMIKLLSKKPKALKKNILRPNNKTV